MNLQQLIEQYITFRKSLGELQVCGHIFWHR
jgi:hypothetical protein